MAATAGKKARVKVSTTSGGTYNNVLGVQTASHELSGSNIDVSELGVDYVQRIQGLKDGRLSLSGNLRTDDTNGQLVIRAALLNDTDLFVKVLPDDGVTVGAGFLQQMRVASWRDDGGVSDKAGWSVELEGTGAASIV